jgi:hypothetical protein
MMKEKLLVLFLLGGLVLVWGCSETPVDQTNGRKFTLEYDHQVNCDVLGWGKNEVEDAFQQANTTLEFEYDDIDLPNSWIRIDSLYEYYIAHVKRDSSGAVMYPGYLCSIERTCDAVGNPLDMFWGYTYSQTGPGIGHSFVVYGNPSLPYGCRAKVTIHELGHQRAGLTHLCLNDTTMNPAHNDSACVMGQGETATCTGMDLCSMPHFCANCRNAIGNIGW